MVRVRGLNRANIHWFGSNLKKEEVNPLGNCVRPKSLFIRMASLFIRVADVPLHAEGDQHVFLLMWCATRVLHVCYTCVGRSIRCKRLDSSFLTIELYIYTNLPNFPPRLQFPIERCLNCATDHISLAFYVKNKQTPRNPLVHGRPETTCSRERTTCSRE
jgi:hypothetical protein